MPHLAPNPSLAPCVCLFLEEVPRLQATFPLFQLLHQLKNSTWLFYFPDETDVLTMFAAAAKFMRYYYTSIFGRTMFFFMLRYLLLLLLFRVSCMTTISHDNDFIFAMCKTNILAHLNADLANYRMVILYLKLFYFSP